ncbi:RNA polymerase sigma factor RpoE [Gemmata obscuriglobus]|uniref:RNA polymerase sigma factor n=1 Tax=Gemmata obscuriglobus TaxID=114 RepID=UPI00016C48BB|nr:sigma-70 family RNA polymerase sigma factor [Gemmata obscuriglobus]QEG30615.1 RNA polymerase sigma factor RpoE [Gemmata obscuriglobus]VTS09939.1 rna polymerase sigma factor y : RNA polymerase sigma factor, sigma-70 family OS=Singulisphaera acidiphila (strain ATCC BAA-1392 / DSM 18658 / VKM B-2454 / MOB10) GN=Sinac_0904 PE=4 SV=1: Sigma70_r2 [Gemmata obscuriglobus UQM 2246]
MIDRRVRVSGQTTSSTLLAGVRARTPGAWERFEALYRPLVLYWCQQDGLRPHDAQDVSQDVFLAADRAMDRFRHDQPGDTLRGWLRMITRNKAHDHRRRNARQIPAVGGSDAQRELLSVPERPERGGGADADAVEERIVLRQAVELTLAGFKDRTRQAFWRYMIDRQRAEDVAQELGIRVHSVYLAKSRVLHRLLEEFGELVDLPEDGAPRPATGSDAAG